MAQRPVKNHFHLIRENQTQVLIDPKFLEWFQCMGFEKVGQILEKSQIDPGRAGRHALRVFCPDGRQDHRYVIRRYGRGGLLRRFLGDAFLFGSRPFRELLVTEEIRQRGVPTVQVVAALHHRVWGPFYRGELITKEIPGTKDLVSVVLGLGDSPSKGARALKHEIAIGAGRAVRFMHNHGVYHGDLNLKNLLVQSSDSDSPKVYIVDFDRSKIMETFSTRKRMKNIFRLNRSADKFKTKGIRISSTDKIRFFHAYAEGDKEAILSLRRYLKHYHLYRKWYRIGWFADRLFNPSSR